MKLEKPIVFLLRASLGLWLAASLALGSEPDEGAAECRAFLEAESEALPSPPQGGLAGLYELDFSALVGTGLPAAGIGRQAREIGRFLRDVYRELPVPSAAFLPFRRVTVVPWRWTGPWRQLEMFGETLVIRVGRRVVTADDLRSRWNRGAQFPWRSPERRLWRYANPTGDFIGAIRRGLRLTRLAAAEALERIERRCREAGNASGDALANEAVGLAKAWLGENDPAVAELEERLTGRSAEAVGEGLAAWRKELSSETAAAGWLATVRVSAGQGEKDADRKVRVRVWLSLVGYGNFHWIRVTVGYGERAQGTVVAAEPRGRNVDVSVIGSIVGGYTIDVVDVRAFFDRLYLGEALRTALGR